MKALLILRHAKAEKDASQGDKGRALTRRGRRDAAAIGQWMGALVGSPDAVVTSDARRAQETADLVASAIGFTGPITTEPDIYDADRDTLLRVVRRLPDSADCVLLVGHNPGCEQLAALLAGEEATVSPLPAARLVYLEFEVMTWRDVRPGEGRLRGVYTPKRSPQEPANPPA